MWHKEQFSQQVLNTARESALWAGHCTTTNWAAVCEGQPPTLAWHTSHDMEDSCFDSGFFSQTTSQTNFLLCHSHLPSFLNICMQAREVPRANVAANQFKTCSAHLRRIFPPESLRAKKNRGCGTLGCCWSPWHRCRLPWHTTLPEIHINFLRVGHVSTMYFQMRIWEKTTSRRDKVVASVRKESFGAKNLVGCYGKQIP